MKEKIVKNMQISLKENSSAFGYSILITLTFGLLSIMLNQPDLTDFFSAMAGSALGFILIEFIVTKKFKRFEVEERERTKLIARFMHFISIGGGLIAAYVFAIVLSGFYAWFAATFCATTIFLILDAIELSIIESDE